MKKLLIGLAILAILLTGAWYWAEGWASRAARDALTGQSDIAAEITPLRRPGRMGLHMQDIAIKDGAFGTVNLSGLDSYIRLLSPATLTLDLPETAVLTPSNVAPATLALTDGQAEVTISPTRALAISDVAISGRDLTLDGAELFDSLDMTARLTHMGVAAPDGSAAAYRVNLDGADLVFGELPETLDIAGAVQVWLDTVPDRAVLESGGTLPQPTGLQTHGLVFALGDMSARLAGRVEADANGLASGQAAIYTSDGPAFVDAAVTAGLLPPDIAAPLRSLLTRLAGEPAPTADPAPITAESVVDEANAEIMAEEVVTLPPAGPGEIRLPIFFGDGITRFGPIPLGPAPRISGF